MRRASTLRRRLLWSLVAVVASTVVALTAVSRLLLDGSLRSRLVADAVAATEFNLAVLTPAMGLADSPPPEALEDSGLLDRFLLRGPRGVTATYSDGTRVAAGSPVPAVSAEFAAIVAGGEIAYEFVESADGIELVTGARLPPDGPDFTFTSPAESLTAASQQVLLVTGGAGLVAIAAGASLALALSRRVLRPVEAAQRAARAMSAGDLQVRLPVEGRDEFADLSSSFNDMAASLPRTIAQLEAARQRERDFIADASHELRTPVTGLVNAARLLAERVRRSASADSDEVRLAALVEADVDRLKRLVDDLLELSHLESASTPVRREPIDLGAVLSALIGLHHPAARLECQVPGPIVTDRHSVERIVGNLLDNARRHAPGAATVLGASLDGRDCVIEVTDEGPGVAAEDLDRIFERFSTGDRSRSSGTGLGMSIAARHAARLGGSITARSPEKGGFGVTVRFPVAELLHDGDDAARAAPHAGDDPTRGAIE